MQLTRTLSWILTLGLVAGLGCTSYAPLQVAASNRPTQSAGASGGMGRGESCQTFFLGIPLGKGNTARAALDMAKGSAGSLTLTDVTMDVSFTAYPFVAKTCTIVHGMAVK